MSASSESLKCGTNVTGVPGIDSMLQKFTSVAGDACIYGCFLSILYENSIQKYSSLGESITRIGTSMSSFMSRAILDPSLLGGADAALIAQLEQMVQMHLDSVQNAITAGSEAFKGASFSDILWSMAKTTTARYAKVIVMAAIQSMVKEMETELNNRANLLGAIRVQLGDLERGLLDVAQYDWWDKFVEAVSASDQQLRDADRSLSTAYDSAREGNWNSENLEMGQWRLTTAWQQLANAGEIEDFINEIGSDFRTAPYLPFDPAFMPVKASSLWNAMSTIGTSLSSLSDSNSCLIKTTYRLQQLRGFILATEAVVKWLDTKSAMSVSMDVIMNDAIIGGVIESIRSIQADMRRVVEERNRLVAPLSLASWKVDIMAQIQLLKTFGALPTPWGLDAYAQESTAMADLQYLLHTHVPKDGTLAMEDWDFSSTFVSDLVGSIIRSAGDIVSLVANKPQWSANIQSVKSKINQLEIKDATARNMLNMFNGHESDKYDYVLQLLNGSGMDGAATMLERGSIKQLLEATALMSVSAGGALACLSSMFGDRAGMSLEAQSTIEGLYDKQFSDAKAAIRSLNTLPSMQLKNMNILQLQIEDSLNEMAFLSGLAEGGC